MNILSSLGIVYGHWVYFARFGMLHQEKSGSPGLKERTNANRTIWFWKFNLRPGTDVMIF
jgi:hypothetical protein